MVVGGRNRHGTNSFLSTELLFEYRMFNLAITFNYLLLFLVIIKDTKKRGPPRMMIDLREKNIEIISAFYNITKGRCRLSAEW